MSSREIARVEPEPEYVVERMDLRQTASVLGALVGYLEAEETVRQAQGGTGENLILKSTRDEHDRLKTLIQRSKPGKRELFSDEHKPVYDALDGIYDCGSDKCPEVGYKSGESNRHHKKMWGFTDPLIDVRNLPKK